MVMVVWGLNFVAIKLALDEIPPFLLLTFRFLGTVFPFIFFIPRPKVPVMSLLWITLFQWVLHFALLFSGMYAGINAGIGSLISQSQIIFTILLSCLFFRFRPSLHQKLGIIVSFIGLVMFSTQGDCSANFLGFALIIGAALSASVANILYRQVGQVNMLSLIVWTSAIALSPMFALSYILEGWSVIQQACYNMSWISISSLGYTALISTFIGIVTWARLMNQCDPGKVVPFTLLVPVVGMSAGYCFLEEVLTPIDLIASTIIIAGLLINQLPLSKSASVVVLENEQEEELIRAA